MKAELIWLVVGSLNIDKLSTAHDYEHITSLYVQTQLACHASRTSVI